MSERPLPENIQGPLRLYRALGPVLATFLLPGILRRLLRRGGWRQDFGQRFGLFTPHQRHLLASKRWTWIHSISVGETLLALKLVRALRAQQPGLPIALSVTTSTGFACALQCADPNLFVFYNPVDLAPVVRKVLDLLQPQRLLFIEGELWPVLLTETWQRNIPIALVNARLSPRSAARFLRWRRWCSPFFQLLNWISVPDSHEIPRWEQLGVSANRLHLTGSIKFDSGSNSPHNSRVLRELLRSLGISDTDPLLIAGSTHDGEELLLCHLLKSARAQFPNLRLILVPRHVERAPEILRLLHPLGFTVACRTDAPSGTKTPDVLLVNVTGELRDWYELATLVFVGKSLTAEGGQNPVEPALAGKPVLFGPHMENFETIVALLLSEGGAKQVRDAAELEATCLSLLADPTQCQQLGLRAQQALKIHEGAANRTADLILRGEAG
jgi:3-deoxy-D-manno-octulosonic-acid transferase